MQLLWCSMSVNMLLQSLLQLVASELLCSSYGVLRVIVCKCVAMQLLQCSECLPVCC